MQLTRRGRAVVALVVVAEVLALLFGARAINAVAAPAVVALVGAAVQVARAEPPTAERSPVRPGFPGDAREVTVDVDGEGVAHAAEVVPDGLDADGAETEATLPASFSYRLSFDERGEYAVGPLRVAVTDVLGLVEATHRVGATTRVLVYPPVYHLAGQQTFLRDVLDTAELERHEFDALREYEPGDPLRDVHWKSSAKDPDTLYVKSFADRRAEGEVTVAATGARGCGDEMAAAAASVAVMVLDAGMAVELVLPRRTVEAGRGEDHRDRLLATLAEAGPGMLDEAEAAAADIHVHAAREGVQIRLDAGVHTLEEITVSRDNPLTDREVTA